MQRFILVGLDSGYTSLWALGRAVILARAGAWDVRIVHVVDEVGDPKDVFDVEQHLRSKIEESFAFPGSNMHLLVRVGSPARILAEQAADTSCLGVMVGASEKSFMGAMMLGKTAEQVLAMVSKPVLLVHSEPRHAYRRVVAAVDFERHSRNALREALSLDLVPDDIQLIHAFTLAVTSADPTMTERKKQEISLRFMDLVRELDLDLMKVGIEAREGPAFTTIANFLDETNADLVILGCYGREPLTRRVAGSTTMALLQKAAADVLVAGRLSQ